MLGVFIGGAAYGFIEKQFPNLPTLPVVGRAGTVALIAHFWKGGGEIVRNIGIAAAAIAGHELGSQGHISGAASSQFGTVHGVASNI